MATILAPKKYFQNVLHTGNGQQMVVGSGACFATDPAPAWNITNSVLFDGSQAMSRTITQASTSQTKATLSLAVKRTLLNSTGRHFLHYVGATNGSGNMFMVEFYNNMLRIILDGTVTYSQLSIPVFNNDVTHLHIHIALDTTQAIAANRCVVMVDGNKLQTTGTQPPQNHAIANGAGNMVSIGALTGSYLAYCYLSEVNYIDGAALPVSTFGGINSYGLWAMTQYIGSYGVNGHYLNFKDNTSLGKDTSGNGNNFTTSGITASSQFMDTPTNNFATLNSVIPSLITPPTAGNLVWDSGNLTYNWYAIASTQPAASLSYVELTPTRISGRFTFAFGFSQACSVAGNVCVGLGTNNEVGFGFAYNSAGSIHVYQAGTEVLTLTSPQPTLSDTFQVAYNPANGYIWLGKNNTWLNNGNPAGNANPTAIVPNANLPHYFTVAAANASGLNVNFGAKGFKYTPPTGFGSMSSKNIPMPATVMVPDLFIGKNRSTGAWIIADAVRGWSQTLSIDTTAEAQRGAGVVTKLVNGIAIGSDSVLNANGANFMSMMFSAGGKTASNTDGTIPSLVSVNPVSGFTIVEYVGTGVAGTVGHGLGKVLACNIVKSLSSTTDSLSCYHKALPSAAYRVQLNSNALPDSGPGYWNNTAPTTTVFSVGTNSSTNAAGVRYVAYGWAEVPGFSTFFGANSNGNVDNFYVDCGFKPGLVINKRTDTTGSWLYYDGARNPFSSDTTYWSTMDSTAAEITQSQVANNWIIDKVSTGFKNRTNSAGAQLGGVGTFIGMAFSDIPVPYGGAN